MLLAAQDLEAVRHIAERTRHDFEAGRVSDDEIRDAAFRYRVGRWVVNSFGDYVPILVGSFPVACCGYAAPVLGRRIDASGVLKHEVELVSGGYFDGETGPDKWHALVRLAKGAIALGRDGALEPDTIADITSDQFRTRPGPPVYVGPLIYPWTDTPTFKDMEPGEQYAGFTAAR